MSSNGMGGRRVGKRYWAGTQGNVEEGTNYWIHESQRISEWEQLIESYNKHNQLIKDQKRKWLEPRVRPIKKERRK